MTRIIKRLVVMAAVAFAVVGVSAATASASVPAEHATGVVSADGDFDWS